MPRRRKRQKMNLCSSELQQYEVESIIDHKIEKGVRMYKVLWKSYGIDEATWQPLPNLTNSMEAIIEYHRTAQTISNKNKFPPKRIKILPDEKAYCKIEDEPEEKAEEREVLMEECIRQGNESQKQKEKEKENDNEQNEQNEGMKKIVKLQVALSVGQPPLIKHQQWPIYLPTSNPLSFLFSKGTANETEIEQSAQSLLNPSESVLYSRNSSPSNDPKEIQEYNYFYAGTFEQPQYSVQLIDQMYQEQQCAMMLNRLSPHSVPLQNLKFKQLSIETIIMIEHDASLLGSKSAYIDGITKIGEKGEWVVRVGVESSLYFYRMDVIIEKCQHLLAEYFS